MADLSGAVDLSEIGKTLGPQESAALQAELRMMAQTRELALRRQVELEAENDGMNKLLAVLVHLFGREDSVEGGYVVAVGAEEVRSTEERFVGFSTQPLHDRVILRVLVAYPGKWNITGREPTEQEREQLAVYEELPEISTRPGDWTVIVSTRKGLRIAEWRPE